MFRSGNYPSISKIPLIPLAYTKQEPLSADCADLRRGQKSYQRESAKSADGLESQTRITPDYILRLDVTIRYVTVIAFSDTICKYTCIWYSAVSGSISSSARGVSA